MSENLATEYVFNTPDLRVRLVWRTWQGRMPVDTGVVVSDLFVPEVGAVPDFLPRLTPRLQAARQEFGPGELLFLGETRAYSDTWLPFSTPAPEWAAAAGVA